MTRNNKTQLNVAGFGAIPAITAGLLTAGAITTNASTDYGPAVWRSAASGHWYTSGNGHKFHVCHDMEGYYASTISYFQQSGTQASVHYCVNGKKDASSDYAAGEVTQMVRDSYYAWHVKCWNTYCTGTEHEGFASNPAWYTDAMYSASAGVTAHLAATFGWAKDRNHVVGHNEWKHSAWRSYASSHFGIDPNCNTHSDPGPYWDWSKYMDLVNGNTARRIDVFVRATDNSIRQKYFSGSSWSPDYINLGGDMTSDPTAASWGPNRIDLFARDTTGSLQHRYVVSGNPWSAWEDLGGYFVGSPDACSWGDRRLDIFARSTNNTLLHIWFDGSWHPWQDLGGTIASDPTAVSWGSGRIDVFARSTNNTLLHIYVNSGNPWSDWEDLGGSFQGSPDACSWATDRLDIFARGTDDSLKHVWWDEGWHPWQTIGAGDAVLRSDPTAVSYGPERIDLFWQDPSGGMKQWYFNGDWVNGANLGGILIGGPDACSWTR